MPPKVRFTKEKVIQAAFDVVREFGPQSFTVRMVSQKMGASSQPIFTHFTSMDDLMAAVMEEARKFYNVYAERGLASETPFKMFTMEYICFAVEEPNLFSLLFMQKRTNCEMDDFLIAEGHYDEVIACIKQDFDMDDELARKFYCSVWMYAHGLATMLWTGIYQYTKEEVGNLITTALRAMLLVMKSPTDNNVSMIPAFANMAPQLAPYPYPNDL